MSKYYSGIGSRTTPPEALTIMESLGSQLSDTWVLRSGYAVGADQAFYRGALSHQGKCENYLPWLGYNNAPQNDSFISPVDIPTRIWTKAMEIAREFHPNWRRCTDAVQVLHTRNTFILLGKHLDTPSSMVICWTPNAAIVGGTGQAMRMAIAHGVPCFNLASEEQQDALIKFIDEKKT